MSLTNSNYKENFDNNIFQKYKSEMKYWIHKSQEVLVSPLSYGDISLRLYDKLKYNTIYDNNHEITKNANYFNKIYKTAKHFRNLNKNNLDKQKYDKKLKNIGEYYKSNITAECIKKDNSIIKLTKDNNKINKKQLKKKKNNP